MLNRLRRWAAAPPIDHGRLEAIQWIALAAMVVDHVGQFFLGSAIWSRTIGRVAFPLFALVFAWRLSDMLRRNPQRSLRPMFGRLVGVGLLSEALFRLITAPDELNILFSFALAAALIVLSLPQRQAPLVPLPWPIRLVLALALFTLASRYVDYQWAGVALLWCLFLYLHFGHASALLAALAALGLLSLDQPIPTAWVAAPLALALLWPKAPWLRVRRPVRYLFYWIYPAHLALIWIAIQMGVPRLATDPGWLMLDFDPAPPAALWRLPS